ncbi:MAG: alpha-N-acetylglucosaminidase N-terminal domain-containing protein, partial [Clostridia bacterium]|nr:alpha-N-acetylglucosaminidase N-terminal domain-containing protein [Clostridia bacterium]
VNGISVKEIEIFEVLEDKVKNYYPAFFDTDLKENYFLDTVSVFTTPEGYSEYSVYTSINGRDFEFLVRKNDDKPCDFSKGDVYSANGREARIIRVYIEYNSASVDALFSKVEFTGEKSGTEIKKRPEIQIEKFEDSQYNIKLTDEDTYNEVYGIVARRIGEEYKNWFTFNLSDNPKSNGYDFFEISFSNGKINIKGNNGVSLATGLNHYLKYYCKVNICQVGDQAKMPADIVPLDLPVFKETKARVRYSYNYCTLSYSMAFWGEKEWQNELDWLAMNGVNVVLDATAQEEVWRRFLTSIGYTHEEVLKFVAGPAYYAWAYMANLSGFGGPVHDSWFGERTELARHNHLIMRKLGMYPVLQGYSGMVPNDICEHDASADVVLQGTWCSFDRPTMLITTSDTFKKYAEKFYKAQTEVYGTYSKYFATDPFHEGGNIGDMSARDVSFEVLSAMLKANSDSVWVIQSWQKNPTSELLAGIADIENGKNHALVLDLYAEKDPNYKKGH